MHFGENQLSRSLIGLSPLPTDHPPGFQPWWVRASTPSYRRFTLPMGRSPRFGPAAHDSHPTHNPHTRRPHRAGVYAPYSDSLSLRLPHNGLTSPHTTTRRLILQKARHHTTPPKGGAGALTACRHTVSGTLSQPLTGALFTFPSRYSSTIGHQGIFRLTTWSWQIHTKFHELRATREHPQGRRPGFAYRTLTVYGRPSQTSSTTQHVLSLPASPDRTSKRGDPTTPRTQ